MTFARKDNTDMIGHEDLPRQSGIYKVENLLNGHIYIGQSKNIYERYRYYHHTDYQNPKCSMYNTKFYQALRKYGLTNFKIEAIELCEQEQLNEREIYWIDYYNSFKCGYNSSSGGQSLTPNLFSPETEAKRAQTREKNQSLKGENHPRAKMTNEEIIKVRVRYKNGENISKIYEDYKDKYESILTFKNIVLGRSYKYVENPIEKSDIRYSNSLLTKEQVLNIRKKFYIDCKTGCSIAKEYGISPSTVMCIVNRITYKHIKDNIPDMRKRKNYRLTSEQVKEIRKKNEEGISYKQLAKEYNIKVDAIRKCCQRKTYKNID